MKIFISKGRTNFFSFSYINGREFFTHKLTLPEKITFVSDDELLRIALLALPMEDKFIEVIGIEPSQIIVNSLSAILNIEILCENYSHHDNQSDLYSISDDTPIYLGFSGGFDSLAAKNILPNCICVSLRFGGYFERESKFFANLDTIIFEWDIRTERLNLIKRFNESRHWRFMLAPLSLLKGNADNIVIATGTIMEAAPYWMHNRHSELKAYNHFGFGKGVSLINPVCGLTEYGTTKIVMRQYNDDFIQNSLKSLSHENSFKRYRKQCLMAAVRENDTFNKIISYPKKTEFGSSFGEDMISLYFCWKFGLDWVEHNYAEGIPNSVKNLDLSFFEKVNVNNLMHIDPIYRKK